MREQVTSISLANDPFQVKAIPLVEKPQKKRTAMKKKAGKKKPGC